MNIHRRAIFHFTDDSTLALEWPKQDSSGHVFLSEALRKAVEARQLLVEADGRLLVIQMANVKFVELIPAPEALPEGAIRQAQTVPPPMKPAA
jgi:hypothetical protein